MSALGIVLLVLLGSSIASLIIGRMARARPSLIPLEGEGSAVPASRTRLRSEISDLDDVEAVSVLRVVQRLKEDRESAGRLPVANRRD